MARCLGADAGETAAFSNGDRKTHRQEKTKHHWQKEGQGVLVRMLGKRIHLVVLKDESISKKKLGTSYRESSKGFGADAEKRPNLIVVSVQRISKDKPSDAGRDSGEVPWHGCWGNGSMY